MIDHNIELYQEFILRASNAGIIHAHGQAADYYLRYKNCDEAEKRMRLLMEDKDNLSAGCPFYYVCNFNVYDTWKCIVRWIRRCGGYFDKLGYPIEKDSTGVYVMLSKREKSL